VRIADRRVDVDTTYWIVPTVVVGVGSTMAAVVDVREYRVPNALTLPLLLLGVLYHTLAGGVEGLQLSLLGAVSGFASLILAYAIGILGGGDVKLVAAIGAWLGLYATLAVVVVSAATAVLYSFSTALFRGARLSGGLLKAFRENLSLWLFRVQVAGRHFIPDERVEVVVSKEDAECQRYHLVPFAAMVAVGCAVVLVGKLLKLL
jgi:prepilin peptidase CpaA